MTNVKWLTSMQIVDRPFEGYQHTRAYRLRGNSDDGGVPGSRMAVRSLLVPHGIPDFLTRRRYLERGDHWLEGQAWSGNGPITTVEVNTDAGRTWHVAELEPPEDPAAWTRWRFHWVAEQPGETQVCCRATDTTGTRQPAEPVWNLGGYAVNAVHRVPVTVH